MAHFFGNCEDSRNLAPISSATRPLIGARVFVDVTDADVDQGVDDYIQSIISHPGTCTQCGKHVQTTTVGTWDCWKLVSFIVVVKKTVVSSVIAVRADHVVTPDHRLPVIDANTAANPENVIDFVVVPALVLAKLTVQPQADATEDEKLGLNGISIRNMTTIYRYDVHTVRAMHIGLTNALLHGSEWTPPDRYHDLVAAYMRGHTNLEERLIACHDERAKYFVINMKHT